MMEEHITFEEMHRFVFPENLSIETINLGTKINAHILTCKECAAQYNALLELRQEREQLNRNRIDSQITSDIKLSKGRERELIDGQMEGEEPSDTQTQTPSLEKHQDRGISN